jgi:hypothetical protein
MSNRPWTLLKSHERAELWRQDRLDPAGDPVIIYRGSTFMRLPNGERRQTPESHAFGTLAEGEAWFEAEIGKHY